MKNKDKVASLELCREMHRLGITKDLETERIWHKLTPEDIWIIAHRFPIHSTDSEYCGSIFLPCPDFIELLELFDRLVKDKTITQYDLFYKNSFVVVIPDDDVGWDTMSEHATTAPNAVARMLIKLNKNV